MQSSFLTFWGTASAGLCIAPTDIHLWDRPAWFDVPNRAAPGQPDGVLVLDIDTKAAGWKFEDWPLIVPAWDHTGSYDVTGQEWLDTSLDLIWLDVQLYTPIVLPGGGQWHVRAWDGTVPRNDWDQWLDLGPLTSGWNTWHFDSSTNASVINHLNSPALCGGAFACRRNYGRRQP